MLMGIRGCLVWLGCLVLPVYAEVYQWRDEQGRVHFGDRPPQNSALPAAKVEPTSTNLYSPAIPLSSPGPGRSAAEVRQMREQRAASVAREEAREAARQQRCQKARQRYDKLSHQLSTSMDKMRARRDELNRIRLTINDLCD